jgi:hypothetical protein
MNGQPIDGATRALDYVSRASTFVLIATMVLLAWVASGVEFANEGLRYASMACLTMSVVFGIATLSLIPVIQEVRRSGQSNFEVDAPFLLFGQRSARLKSMLLPQYALLLAGLLLYVIGMMD